MTLHPLALTRRRSGRPLAARVAATLLIALASYALLVAGADAQLTTPPAPRATAPESSPGTDVPAASGTFADTFATLARRADAGCTASARLALQMAQDGPRVYGMRFPVSPGQRRQWQRQAECREPPCAAIG